MTVLYKNPLPVPVPLAAQNIKTAKHNTAAIFIAENFSSQNVPLDTFALVALSSAYRTVCR